MKIEEIKWIKKRKGDSEMNKGSKSTACLQHRALFTETCIPECPEGASSATENTRKTALCWEGFGEGDWLGLNALPRISDSNL